MRLQRDMIERISAKIVDRLLRRELVEIGTKPEEIQAMIAQVITEDLMVEDRLNEEVKELLHSHQEEMDRTNVDYSRIFTMVKTKLARERNLVL